MFYVYGRVVCVGGETPRKQDQKFPNNIEKRMLRKQGNSDLMRNPEGSIRSYVSNTKKGEGGNSTSSEGLFGNIPHKIRQENELEKLYGKRHQAHLPQISSCLGESVWPGAVGLGLLIPNSWSPDPAWSQANIKCPFSKYKGFCVLFSMEESYN